MTNVTEKALRDLTEEMQEEMVREHERDLERFKDYDIEQINSHLEESLLKTDLIVDALNSLPSQTTERGAILLNAVNDTRMAIEVVLAWLETNHPNTLQNTPEESDIAHEEEL